MKEGIIATGVIGGSYALACLLIAIVDSPIFVLGAGGVGILYLINSFKNV